MHLLFALHVSQSLIVFQARMSSGRAPWGSAASQANQKQPWNDTWHLGAEAFTANSVYPLRSRAVPPFSSQMPQRPVNTHQAFHSSSSQPPSAAPMPALTPPPHKLPVRTGESYYRLQHASPSVPTVPQRSRSEYSLASAELPSSHLSGDCDSHRDQEVIVDVEAISDQAKAPGPDFLTINPMYEEEAFEQLQDILLTNPMFESQLSALDSDLDKVSYHASALLSWPAFAHICILLSIVGAAVVSSDLNVLLAA